jgi:hypothetical protein
MRNSTAARGRVAPTLDTLDRQRGWILARRARAVGVGFPTTGPGHCPCMTLRGHL